MGGLLTVQQFLSRFPQVDIVNDASFHDAWVTGTLKNTLVLLRLSRYRRDGILVETDICRSYGWDMASGLYRVGHCNHFPW